MEHYVLEPVGCLASASPPLALAVGQLLADVGDERIVLPVDDVGVTLAAGRWADEAARSWPVQRDVVLSHKGRRQDGSRCAGTPGQQSCARCARRDAGVPPVGREGALPSGRAAWLGARLTRPGTGRWGSRAGSSPG